MEKRVLFLYTPDGAGGASRNSRCGRPGPINADETNEIRRRYGWENIGLPLF
jgi:hypothetical protein